VGKPALGEREEKRVACAAALVRGHHVAVAGVGCVLWLFACLAGWLLLGEGKISVALNCVCLPLFPRLAAHMSASHML